MIVRAVALAVGMIRQKTGLVPFSNCHACPRYGEIRLRKCIGPKPSSENDWRLKSVSAKSKDFWEPMAIRDVKKSATEILLGLSALHARGMLHRDTKPANVLLDGHGVAKLADLAVWLTLLSAYPIPTFLLT